MPAGLALQLLTDTSSPATVKSAAEQAAPSQTLKTLMTQDPVRLGAYSDAIRSILVDYYIKLKDSILRLFLFSWSDI